MSLSILLSLEKHSIKLMMKVLRDVTSSLGSMRPGSTSDEPRISLVSLKGNGATKVSPTGTQLHSTRRNIPCEEKDETF